MSYQFHGQRTNEQVLLVSRRHPFVLFHPLFISTLVLLIPFVVQIFFPVGTVLSIAVAVCVLAAIIYGVEAWMRWRNTTLLLSNERVVFLEQRALMHREFTECTLSSIRQVSHQVRGLRQTLWRYGDIAIYTIGAHQPIVIREIPDPYEVQQEILRTVQGEGFIEEE